MNDATVLAKRVVSGLHRTRPIRNMEAIDITYAFNSIGWEYVMALIRSFNMPG